LLIRNSGVKVEMQEPACDCKRTRWMRCKRFKIKKNAERAEKIC
jgi:hypothetical protein